MNKSLLISHCDCDGISCILLALQYNIAFDKMIVLNYDEQDLEDNNKLLIEYDKIYYSDLSPSPLNLQTIFESKPDCKLVILDHHTSAQEHINQYITDHPEHYINYIYDPLHCGTFIMLDWIERNIIKKPACNIIKEYVKLVDNYDMWREELGVEEFEKPLDLNRLFYKLIKYNDNGLSKYDFFINNQLQKFKAQNVNQKFYYYMSEQKKIKDSKEKETEKLIETKKNLMVRTDERGKKFGLVTMRSGASIIAHYLLCERTDLDYLIIINCYDEQNLKLSLRSKRFNLLSLLNIKGHMHSAGAEGWEQKDILKLSRNIIKSIPYKNKVR